MSIEQLLATLASLDIQLALKDGQLAVQGNRQALGDPQLVAQLREHKPALIALLASGGYQPGQRGPVLVPANGIADGCSHITPAMLTLAELDQGAIDRLLAQVPGGAANVQDIYPLAPLQQGILYHHASSSGSDPYVMQAQFAFADRQRLDAFAEALRGVIARHDILRTSVHWEGLEQPLQVVWRQAPLQVEEGEDARRLDLAQAPLIRLRHRAAAADGSILASLQFHHIALDHSALDVVRHEMQALLQGQGASLGTPVPFRNYVAQACLGVSEAQHEAFFRTMLGDLDSPTLAYQLQDVQADSGQTEEHSLALDSALCLRIRAQARACGVSVGSLFHLGWAQVLGALTGQASVVFGTVLMGRLQGAEATDRALGIFINTLPLRVELGALAVAEALKATHQRLATLMRHEHAPLALAQRCSAVAAPTPLFNSLLNYRHSAIEASAQARAAWAGIDILHSEERSNYPLTLSVDDLGEGLRLTLLASAQVPGERVCGYLEQTMQALVDALEQGGQAPLQSLSVLPAAERRWLLDDINTRQHPHDLSLTLHQQVEHQALAQPTAIAASCLGQTLDYATLNHSANALAHQLIGLGVGPDARVAVVARRGLDTLVGLLAVLKAGGAYVPVDPAHPDERIAYLLADSAPKVVLTQQALRGRLDAVQVPLLNLDQPDWPARDDNPQVTGLNAANLAYVIYTSGSTGLPKGVMVEHRTLANLVGWHCRAFDLGPGRHTSSLAGFGFDAMAWELWPALCGGATVHIAPPGDGNDDLDVLLSWWQAQPLDVSFLPTPVAEYAFSQQIGHPTLRTLLIGGDRLRQFNRNQTFSVVNNYGPTETTVVASSGVVQAGGVLHIGAAVDNTRLYVLDGQCQPVPLQVAGELYVGGAGVARGYLGRPDLTAERFVDDPFHGGRMYRTGDLVRWLADGTLEYLGRNDDQVKIRGVRIELGEIESRLNSLPGINEAVVVAREDQPGQARLVAYFTAQPEVEVAAPAQLRAQLQAHLPDYMVPVAYVALPALPLTANGKLDRRALPAPDRTALFERGYEAPQGELEHTLAHIWSELLQVERVGRRDHFFELGGHSLLAMRLASQVRLRLGAELALNALFAHAELAALAGYLASAEGSELPPIVAAPAGQTGVLSYAQQRLWFLAQMGDAGQAYHIPLALGLRGALDAQALEAALLRIVERHQALRSCFVAEGEQVQVLTGATPAPGWLQRLDLRQAPQQMAASLQQAAAQPFDLGNGPLLRASLLQLADDYHVLAVTVHHIVADGGSLAVLTAELSQLYPALRQGLADPLPPLALQYADYALWQRRWLDGERLAQQVAYWQPTLAGAPALLTLPWDRPRPARQDYAGATLPLRLDAGLSAGLRSLALRHGATPYMVLLSAWASLLARLAGQPEVVIGCPVAGRDRAELEGLVGLFVNTLALRIALPEAASTEVLLGQVKARLLEAQAHQALPFEQVVEALRPARSLAHAPLLQTTLNWLPGSLGELELDGLQIEGVAQAGQVAKFDLSLNLGEQGECIVGSLEYATALFDESSVRRYGGYFEQLLRAMVANDQAELAGVELLEPEERNRLVRGFNATAAAYDLEQTVHGLIEAQVQISPEAIAVRGEEGELSFAQLNAKANRLAHHLIALGVKPDDRVAICVERGLAMVVGLLAILKAGGAYVPVDPDYPAERINHMLTDSAPVAVLVHGATRQVPQGLPVVDLDYETWADLSAENPEVIGLTPNHLAYVIYTSGSTGLPKGVMNEHRGVVNRLLWTQQQYQLGADDVVLQKTPFSFDVSVWEFFWPLQTGACLVMARPGGHKDPAYLRDVIAQQQVTTLHFVPSMLDAFLAHGDAERAAMKRVLCSGEALPGSLVRRFKAQLAGVELHNLYGPTEAAVDVSAWHCAEPLEQTPDNTPIGKPVANTQLYVLDAYGQPTPQGVAGELYIGGVQVARGYLNCAELSAERFIDDTFTPGGRLYRTGDLARYLPDGNLEYLGRNDDQVKLRGLRIELGEIQACLTRIDGIQEAAVLAPELQGERRLVAYYTGNAQAVEVLRDELLRHLPEFMVPALFVHLQALPLSPNGKLDRKALPVPGAEALTSRPYEAPQGATEQLLAEVWAELLGLERVGRHDNFFELGGHSLLALTLLARLRSRGLQVDIHVLFAEPSLSALAATVASNAAPEVPANRITGDCQGITPDLLALVALEQPAIDSVVASVTGGAANVQDIYPLGPLQAGILYHHLANPGQADPYLQQVHFAFSDASRLHAFATALQAAIARHDSLRSSLHWDGLPTPVQAVWRQAHLPVQEVTALDDPAHGHMDLTQAPLLRLLHCREAGRIQARLQFHHAVLDHVALEVLVHELQALLLGEAQQLPAPVPYRNYIAQTLRSAGSEAAEAFFRAQLADIDEPTLPYGSLRPHGSDAPRQAQKVLAAPLSRQLREQARQAGVSAASLVHLAWALVLGQLSGRDSVVFGSVLLGRLAGGEGSERALGVFINSLPLRIDLADVDVAEGVRATHQRLSELLRHEHAQLALAQRCSGLPAGAPLFSALLNYRHGGAAANGQARAWQGIELLQAEERSNYPLALSVDDDGEGFTLTAQSAEGIDAGRICAYLEQALMVLSQSLAEAPGTPLSSLSMLPGAERSSLLEGFNATDRDYPRELPVHRLFEQRVASQPLAVAAVEGSDTLRYGELNERANRLAHYLIGQGVAPGDAVAILLPRSLELLVAQLAVAKCAAVYVPLDINAPSERQAFMLADSQAVALLCRAADTLECPSRRIALDRLALHDMPGHNPGLAQGGGSVAYVMYTSGSSGAPKGVQTPHRGIARLVLNNGYADFNAGDCMAFAANPAFDASTVEVWGALLNGGQLRVIDQATLLDPARLAPVLGEVSVMFLTTALFNQYVQLIPETLARLRVLMCGGERGEPAAFRRLLAVAPQLRLVHCYGPTETTGYATTSEVRSVPEGSDSVPIGRPIGNTRVYVLDGHGRPLPVGVVGELHIGGDGVAAGYLNRPQLTAERFVDDPFSGQPGARLYRTGDLGYWREDGQLECLGRNDDQVKIRGFRIELGEIEQHMARCPGIGEAVVQALRLDQGPLRLLAWYSRRDPALSSEQLRTWLQARVPEYMVPVALVAMDSLPLNNNGKVDRKALPLPAAGAIGQDRYEAPATALERRLAQVWGEVLEVAQVGRHDSFFELGGHSLSAIRLVNRLQQEGLASSLAELFQHPTVAAQAKAMQQQGTAQQPEGLVTVRGEGDEPPLFLLHEFSGLELYFPVLGQHLPAGFPVYGVPGIPLGQAQPHTLECLASRAIERIRAVQPEGPYRLAGWSFGGVLAYEIAAQLRGADQAVSFLGLIDSFLPRLTDQGKPRWQGPWLLERHLLLHCSQYWQAQGAAGLVQLAKLKVLEQQAPAFAELLAACRDEQLLYAALAEAEDTALRHFLERELAHGHALAHYRVEPLDVPVQLFCARQRSGASPAQGWADTLGAGQVHAVEVPGDHRSMMQPPHVQALGQALGDALAVACAPPGAAHQPLVAIQSGQPGQAPLFCVPGAGDSVTRFVGLADALGPDRPLYGLQPRGLEGAGVPHREVEAAARCHVQALQALYPQGPVHLLGHSFGGWVAHAMACQLQAAGREVGSLTLVDSEAPASGSVCGRPYTTTAALQRLVESLQLGSGKALGLDAEAFAAADDDQQLQLLHTAMQQAGLLPARAGVQALAGTLRTFSAALRTVYRPQGVYQGPASLVLVADPTLDSAGSQREQAAMRAGWQRLLPQLAVWEGPGDHYSVLKAPQVYSLAAWWQDGQARVCENYQD
ncbi:amino acid adenylation domain-containing protein [Pseudomonas xanthosomatis]|uniref:non-ribosomal peptide synthetase n=1 Tax=Pseudomonas xanthosomatis TaxID=2842356 RepID=UPI001C3D3C73|nr:non-ribosomal peptide synthetase [Pseudomonas xanthosomatis]QXH44671.1 amino acid adenylation domain-containing protein [Pseudomonas xanthosomatis]